MVAGFVAVADGGGGGGKAPPLRVGELNVSWSTTPDEILVEYRLTGGKGGRLSATVEYLIVRDLHGPVDGRPQRATPLALSQSLEDVPREETRVFLWDAKGDLEDESAEVIIIVTPLEKGDPGEQRRSRPERAGNMPPEIEITDVTNVRNLLFAFLKIQDPDGVLSDSQAGDPVEVVEAAIAVESDEFHVLPPETIVDPHALRSSPEGEQGTLIFDVNVLAGLEGDLQRDLTALSAPGFVGYVKLALRARDFPSDEQEVKGPEGRGARFDNNDPPELTSLEVGPEQLDSGVIPIRYKLSDAEGNPASLKVLVDLGDGRGLRPANEFPSRLSHGLTGLATTGAGGDPESAASHVFLWDAASQARGDENVTVTVFAFDREWSVASEEVTLSFSWLTKAGSIATGTAPVALTSGDFDGDAFLDVVVGNEGSADVTYLRGGPRGLEWVRNIPTGGSPAALATGNFDGDSYDDVVVALKNADSVTVLRGGSDGPSKGENIRTGYDPAAVTTGRYNGDEYDDVVVANESAGDVTYLEGGPDGLRKEKNIPTGDRPTAVITGDYHRAGNDEHFDDVVVANKGSGRVTVLRGGPDGLRNERDLRTGDGPNELTTGDYNGDGFEDVLVAHSETGALAYLEGSAGGLVLSEGAADIAVGDAPAAFVTADYNGDGVDDVAVADLRSGSVTCFRGGPHGLVQVAQLETGRAPAALTSGDYNGDGFLDVAVTDISSDTLTFLRGGRDGLRSVAEMTVGRSPEAVTTGDYDGDGIGDLVVANRGSGDVTVLRGSRGGLSRKAEFAAGAKPAAMTSADFDGDGFDDLVAANEGSDNVTYLRGGARGLRRVGEIRAGDAPKAVAAGDYDGDGFLDLVVVNTGSRDVTCLRGSPEGLLWVCEVDLEPGGRTGNPRAITSGDYDGDGLCDVAVANENRGELTYLKGVSYESGQVCLLEDPHRPISLPAGFTDIAAMASGDYNGDGFVDVVAAIQDVAGKVTFAPGGPGGLGGDWMHVDVGHSPLALTCGDFNGDGFLDVLVANELSNDVTVLEGGPGGLERVKEIGVGAQPQVVTSGDFDADGFSDVIVASKTSNDAITYLRGGPGGLCCKRRVPLCPVECDREISPAAIQRGDFDGDGVLDALVANAEGSALTFLRGTPAGPLWAGEIEVAEGPTALTSGDYDGDGLLDVGVANSGPEALTILRQTYLTSHANKLLSRMSPGYHLAGDTSGFAALLTDEPSGTSHENTAVGHGHFLDPRVPARYQLDLPHGALASPTQVCAIPGSAFELPQGEASLRSAFLTAVTDSVTVLRESTRLGSSARLTLRLRDHDPALLVAVLENPQDLKVLREHRASGVGRDTGLTPRIVGFAGGRGVTFPITLFGSYVVALERDRE